jgi:hypothetical protein
MALAPLFTQPELEAAFALVLPAKAAKATARRWWREFASEVDERGYFVYDEPLEKLGLPHTVPQVVARRGQMSQSKEAGQERAFWSSITSD